MTQTNTQLLYRTEKEDPYDIPIHLVFQAVMCATKYSDWDIRMMSSGLTEREKELVQSHLSEMRKKDRTNDRIARAIAILQDLTDMRERNSRKIEIHVTNPKGVQSIPVRFIP